MARQFFFAIALIGIGALLNSSAKAVPDAARCEDQAANCVGRCANPGAGTNENKCMGHCDRQVNACLIRAHDASWRR
jgi:hypothetical protein